MSIAHSPLQSNVWPHSCPPMQKEMKFSHALIQATGIFIPSSLLTQLSDAVMKRLLINVPLETGFVVVVHLSAGRANVLLSQEVT